MRPLPDLAAFDRCAFDAAGPGSPKAAALCRDLAGVLGADLDACLEDCVEAAIQRLRAVGFDLREGQTKDDHGLFCDFPHGRLGIHYWPLMSARHVCFGPEAEPRPLSSGSAIDGLIGRFRECQARALGSDLSALSPDDALCVDVMGFILVTEAGGLRAFLLDRARTRARETEAALQKIRADRAAEILGGALSMLDAGVLSLPALADGLATQIPKEFDDLEIRLSFRGEPTTLLLRRYLESQRPGRRIKMPVLTPRANGEWPVWLDLSALGPHLFAELRPKTPTAKTLRERMASALMAPIGRALRLRHAELVSKLRQHGHALQPQYEYTVVRFFDLSAPPGRRLSVDVTASGSFSVSFLPRPRSRAARKPRKTLFPN